MAGNSWQPSHEPPQKAGTRHTEQVSGKRKGRGGGDHYILSPHDCETPQNKCLIKLPQNTKTPQCFNTVEHTVTHKTPRACGNLHGA